MLYAFTGNTRSLPEVDTRQEWSHRPSVRPAVGQEKTGCHGFVSGRGTKMYPVVHVQLHVRFILHHVSQPASYNKSAF